MQIPPHITITPQILDLISKIDANRIFLDSIQLSQIAKENIQRVSLLQSSLFSARIEGNPLTIESLQNTDEEQKKKEVFNILKTLQTMNSTKKIYRITKDSIRAFHKSTMNGISPDAGYFRRDASAIFNSAGIAVYVTPSPGQISQLLDALLGYINSKDANFPLITAFLTHLIFEKIHPFIDGNGRVGRLLIIAILRSKGWMSPIFIPFEEYLDSHKSEYYYHLDNGLKQTQEYLFFMLEGFLYQTEKIKKSVFLTEKENEEVLLPLRQQEIYTIIKEHTMVSFEQIQRRFLNVPARTLRYDFFRLAKKGLIVKIGTTRGSVYKAKS